MGVGPIKDLIEHTYTAVSKDWKNIWKMGCASLRIEFFEKVY